MDKDPKIKGTKGQGQGQGQTGTQPQGPQKPKPGETNLDAEQPE